MSHIGSFEIMGHRIDIRYGRVPATAWAMYVPDKKVILMSPRIKKMPKSHFDHTLYHEITHCVLDYCGLEELNEDETKVDLISNAVYQLVSTIKFVASDVSPPAG